MNARTYYRNSVLAFPRTTAYSCQIERPRESRWQVILGCVCIGLVFAVLLAFGMRP